MCGSGEDQKEVIRSEFNRSIMTDFQDAKITSDVGFLLLRETDERFGILAPMGNDPEKSGSAAGHQALAASDGSPEGVSDSRRI